jgi:predicted membrane-bound spermidine synthase
MGVKEFFYPEVIKKFHSDFNAEVELVRFMGDLRLDMGGLTQSGSVIEKIWAKAIKSLVPRNSNIKSVLILGLGGGSAIKVVKHFYKDAKIVAVEIDPVVVDIATNHFPYIKKYQVDVITSDAVEYVKKMSGNYDLVLVDCYQGHNVPAKLNSLEFVKKILKHTKYLLINRLFWAEFKKPALDFKSSLETELKVSTTRTPSNLIILVQAADIS